MPIVPTSWTLLTAIGVSRNLCCSGKFISVQTFVVSWPSATDASHPATFTLSISMLTTAVTKREANVDQLSKATFGQLVNGQ